MQGSHFSSSWIANSVLFANITMYMPGMGIAAFVVSMRAGQSDNRQF